MYRGENPDKKTLIETLEYTQEKEYQAFTLLEEKLKKEGKPVNESRDPQELIEERESTHGDFGSKACFIQSFKFAIRDNKYNGLNYPQLEALDNIVQKIGRIVYGDANCQDHWDDIAGYAKLANMEPVK